MKEPDKFDLDIDSIQYTLDALDVVRSAFEKRSSETGISKKQFADWIGKDPSYVSRVLNGRVSNVNYQTIVRMLVALKFAPSLDLRDELVDVIASNYQHCLDVEDRYERVFSPRWRIALDGADEERSVRNNKFGSVVTVNG